MYQQMQNDTNNDTGNDTGNDSKMDDSPLQSCISQVDAMIQKGGASKEELMSLKSDLESIQQDIEGEESQEGEQPNHKGIMIAIGLGKKGEQK